MSEPFGGHLLRKGDERTRQIASLGGKSTARSRRKPPRKPYDGTIIDLADAAGMKGPSWQAWRSLLRCIFCLPLRGQDRATFTAHTEREQVPTRPPSEVWIVAGRRAGKSRIASLLAEYFGITFDHSNLAPGETGILPVLSKDKRQSQIIHRYARALTELEPFERYTLSRGESRGVISHHTGVDLEIMAASFRSLRGHTFISGILDEVAYWYDEERSVNPDSAILTAIRPGLATVDNSMLVAISSPYARRGELFATYDRYWGVDDEDVLVINADTRSLNPTVPQRIIDRAYEKNPASAAAEYGSQGRVSFRSDVAGFLDLEAIQAVTVYDRRELPPQPNTSYYAFTDPSGGRHDSFTLGIAHFDPIAGLAVLDCVRERRPPFDPSSVVEEFCQVLRSYGCHVVIGDRYAGSWVSESFNRFGIRYLPSKTSKGDIYLELLPAVNSAQVALLDNGLLRAQLGPLERRTRSGGRDSVDHGVGARDDVANACAGALVGVLPGIKLTGGRKVRHFAFV